MTLRVKSHVPNSPQVGTRTLRSFLSQLIVVVVAPLVLLAVFLSVDHLRSEASAREAEARGVAMVVATALDRTLRSRIRGLQMLAASPALDEPFAAEEARRFALSFVDVYDSHVVVADRDGRMLLNTRTPTGAPLTTLPMPRGRAAAPLAIATGQPQVGDLFVGPQAGIPLVAIAVPVVRGAATQGVVLTTLDEKAFEPLLQGPYLPRGWALKLLDGQGQRIASRGVPAEGPARAAGEARRYEAGLTLAQWRVVVEIPAAMHADPLERAGLSMLVALVLATLAALLGGRVASARLERGVDSLARPLAATDGGDDAGIHEIRQARLRLADAEQAREVAQAALRRSERSYRLLFAAHPHPMWVFAHDSLRFVEVNEAALASYGWSREEFLSMTIADLRRPEDRHLLADAVGGTPQQGRLRSHPAGTWILVCRDGRQREVEITWSDIDFQGRTARLALAVDVTERNELQRRGEEAHQAAVRARELLEQTMQRVEDGFIAVDRDWRFTFVNESAARVAGRTQRSTELLGQVVVEAMPELRDSALHRACLDSLANGEPTQVEQYLEPPGRWLGCRIFPSAEGLSIYFTDITQPRQAREALSTSEKRYRLLFEANPNPMWVFDLQTLRFLSVNECAVRHYGYSRGEFLQMTIAEIHRPEDVPPLRHALAAPPDGPGGVGAYHGVWKHVTRDGRLIDVEITGGDIEFEGRVARLVLAHDVTDRQRLASELEGALDKSRRAERSLREVMERIEDGVIALDSDGRYTYVNARAAALIGVEDAATLIGRTLYDVYPERSQSAFAVALRTAVQTQQTIVLNDHFGPTDRWFEDRIYPSADGVSVYFSDITERRRTEAQLRRSERHFRTLSEQMPAIVYRAGTGPSSPPAYVSPHVATLGYAPEEWVRNPEAWMQTVHPEDLPAVQRALADAVQQRREVVLEYRLRDRAGRWRHFADYGRYVEDEEGGEPYLQGVMVEITELKRTGQALRDAEAAQRGLFDAMAEGVLIFDAGHRVIDANPAALAMLGYSRDELRCLGLDDLLPPHERTRMGEVVAAMTQPDSHLLVEWEHLRKDGSVFPVEVSGRAIGDGRYVKVLRDVTDRRSAQRALVAYQVELSELNQRLLGQERETNRRIAQALHDHLGQTLAVARLHLDATTVAMAGQIPDLLQRECHRVSRALDQAIGDVRAVLGELRPPLLDEQGLLAALDNEIRVRGGERADVDVLLEVDDALLGRRWGTDVEYGAFMVAREAIVNAQRHAGASLVRVLVDGDDHRLQLEVIDDGVGIPEPLRQGRPGHLGLVGMRERALAIGATFSIDSPTGGGTRVLLRWEERAR